MRYSGPPTVVTHRFSATLATSTQPHHSSPQLRTSPRHRNHPNTARKQTALRPERSITRRPPHVCAHSSTRRSRRRIRSSARRQATVRELTTSACNLDVARSTIQAAPVTTASDGSRWCTTLSMRRTCRGLLVAPYTVTPVVVVHRSCMCSARRFVYARGRRVQR